MWVSAVDRVWRSAVASSCACCTWTRATSAWLDGTGDPNAPLASGTAPSISEPEVRTPEPPSMTGFGLAGPPNAVARLWRSASNLARSVWPMANSTMNKTMSRVIMSA